MVHSLYWTVISRNIHINTVGKRLNYGPEPVHFFNKTGVKVAVTENARGLTSWIHSPRGLLQILLLITDVPGFEGRLMMRIASENEALPNQKRSFPNLHIHD